ncbi:MAG: FAD:protein FMN transferase [Prevotellaceae bacterium]|jgi:thiamine biosynthesis lipoprotein|nr:FAD:protein FMN transferase [Prevotellaceae bacterium]
MKYLVNLLLGLSLVACSSKRQNSLPEYMTVKGDYITISGLALGTSFKIIYKDSKKRNYYDSLMNVFNDVENSLSLYRKNSIISKVNRNEDVVLDDYFINMFNRAREITGQTGGAFDISAAPLFEIWGWGEKEKIKVTPEIIDSLKQYTGMDKIRIEGRKACKTNPNVRINANAIAKGYCSDIVAGFIERQGINDYLVEVGGETALKGKNRTGKEWRIGIDKPFDGNLIPGQSLQAIISVSDKSLATSGDYRRYYVEDGKKYSHTIDPETGYSAKQNVLSVTVIAADCMTADALATAFMVMGLEKTKAFLQQNPDIEVFLLYSDEDKIKEFVSENMKHRIVNRDEQMNK